MHISVRFESTSKAESNDARSDHIDYTDHVGHIRSIHASDKYEVVVQVTQIMCDIHLSLR